VARGGGERVGVGGLCARLAPGIRRYAYWRSSAGCSSTPCGSSSTKQLKELDAEAQALLETASVAGAQFTAAVDVVQALYH